MIFSSICVQINTMFTKKEFKVAAVIEFVWRKCIRFCWREWFRKTMLFRILSGLVKPTTGKVCLNRTDIHKGRCSERIGVIIENSCMWPELTGWENLLFLRLCYRI